MSGELSSVETPLETAGDRRDWVEFVRFRLGDDTYELELGRVEQILKNPTVTEVPRTGPAIAGVTNRGGEFPVVVDGRALLGLPPRSPEADRILLALDRGNVQPTGLLVDDVVGIEAHHVDHIGLPDELDDWDPAVGRRWFRAVVADPDREEEPTGVFDLNAVVDEARGRS